ncbi:type II secretion system protein [bacterium]|nr:type II secretion system protein [bacterium]
MMKKGFTLSEVLITLSIVGVVAVLTIPSVVKNYRNRLYVSQLQKVTAQIENAAAMLMADEHVDNFKETSAFKATVGSTGLNGRQYFLRNYFKTAKVGTGSTNSILGPSYRSISGVALVTPNYDCIQTKNGAAVCLTLNSVNNFIHLIVDVNGKAEPNITGRDYFLLTISDDGTVRDHNADTTKCNTYVDWGETNPNSYAHGCFQAIVDAGWKMEY